MTPVISVTSLWRYHITAGALAMMELKGLALLVGPMIYALARG